MNFVSFLCSTIVFFTTVNFAFHSHYFRFFCLKICRKAFKPLPFLKCDTILLEIRAIKLYIGKRNIEF